MVCTLARLRSDPHKLAQSGRSWPEQILGHFAFRNFLISSQIHFAHRRSPVSLISWVCRLTDSQPTSNFVVDHPLGIYDLGTVRSFLKIDRSPNDQLRRFPERFPRMACSTNSSPNRLVNGPKPNKKR